MEAFQPILDRLMKILSGDPSAVDTAVAPQVRGVIDQYDTARKNTAEFSPRGGGSNAVQAGSRVNEAADIAGVKSNAIKDAIAQLSQLGSTELSAGTTQQAEGLQGLLQTLQGALQGKAQDAQLWSDVGSAVGTFAMLALL